MILINNTYYVNTTLILRNNNINNNILYSILRILRILRMLNIHPLHYFIDLLNNKSLICYVSKPRSIRSYV